MREQLQIVDATIQETAIHFLVQQHLAGTPAGKMITDSDNMSFVYLFDQQNGYTHLHFPQQVWFALLEVLQTEKSPMLQCGEYEVELIHMKEELTMLVYNIEGNGNYGEAFTNAVEQAFQPFLHESH